MSNGSSASESSRRLAPGVYRSKTAPNLVVALGAGCLGISVVSALLLTLADLGLQAIPGCIEGSPCRGALRDNWSRIPFIDYPISFLGLAYFTAAIGVWVPGRGVLSSPLRLVVRIGAVVSIVLILVMVARQLLCHYCIAAHAGNVAFWLVAELSRIPVRSAKRSVTAFGVILAVTSAVLIAVERDRAGAGRPAAAPDGRQPGAGVSASVFEKRPSDQSRDPLRSAPGAGREGAVTSRLRRPARSRPDPSLAVGALTDGRGPETASQAPSEADEPSPGSFSEGFTGRHHIGPERAGFRVVAFIDYQCPSCRELHLMLRELLAVRDDLSLSVKHFPACKDCSPCFEDVSPHRFACRAAQAVEAAGMLWGNDGFWLLHDAMFDHQDQLGEEWLLEEVRFLGRDTTRFYRALNGKVAGERVRRDIDEAIGLGIETAPMVFLNGVEVQGERIAESLRRTVSAWSTHPPAPRPPALDRPQAAADRFLARWQQQAERPLPADPHPRVRGPDDAAVKIVLWGDYQNARTCDIDAVIRDVLSGTSAVQYSFRHYPLSEGCNPSAAGTERPVSCLAAKAAEAAGLLAGPSGFWRMHDWLISNRAQLSDVTLRQAADELGMNSDELFLAMDQPLAAAAIQEDASAGHQAGLEQVPWLFINGKRLPAFYGQGEDILQRILNQAGRADPSPERQRRTP